MNAEDLKLPATDGHHSLLRSAAPANRRRMSNEAVRALVEEVVWSPRDGDMGAIFGMGFSPFRGGPFQHLDRVGARQPVEVLGQLRSKYGGPAPRLIEMAEQGLRFHCEG